MAKKFTRKNIYMINPSA